MLPAGEGEERTWSTQHLCRSTAAPPVNMAGVAMVLESFGIRRTSDTTVPPSGATAVPAQSFQIGAVHAPGAEASPSPLGGVAFPMGTLGHVEAGAAAPPLHMAGVSVGREASSSYAAPVGVAPAAAAGGGFYGHTTAHAPSPVLPSGPAPAPAFPLGCVCAPPGASWHEQQLQSQQMWMSQKHHMWLWQLQLQQQQLFWGTWHRRCRGSTRPSYRLRARRRCHQGLVLHGTSHPAPPPTSVP